MLLLATNRVKATAAMETTTATGTVMAGMPFKLLSSRSDAPQSMSCQHLLQTAKKKRTAAASC